MALARLIYSDVDICLLDDPLSAVDAHVGRHIFDHVIGSEGLLGSKTRILVTNAINYLPEVDLIFVLKDGCIAEQGTYQELLNQKGPFAEYLIQYLKDTTGKEEDESKLLETLETSVQELMKQESVEKSVSPMKQLNRSKSTTTEEPNSPTKQYETEKMETGKVSLGVYIYYVRNMGLFLFSSCLLFYISYQACSAGK